MLKIITVYPHSVARELDIEAGDSLVSVNGQPVRDLIDARFYLADAELLLELEKSDGEIWELEIELGEDDELGMEFAHPEPSRCGNNCQFCYVHQLPRGLRSTLYVKDEDYRFSFLYGAYVTLANMGEADLQRILEQRLSPLYISVHATDLEVRNLLLGKQAEPVLPVLQRLVDGGISLHTQIVLCPGINDGEMLEKSIAELAGLRPGILSLAVVPVGLTGHRQALPDLHTPSPEEAAEVLDRIEAWQQKLLADGGRFVFAADEFYLKAGRAFPAAEFYEGFPQLENGIGLISSFRQDIDNALAEAVELPSVRLTTVTGRAFYPELQKFAERLADSSAVELQVIAVPSRLLGGEISVAGLICGEDILACLQQRDLGEGLLLPDIMLRDGADQLLDDCMPDDLGRRLACRVQIIESSALGLIDGISDLLEQGPLNHDENNH